MGLSALITVVRVSLCKALKPPASCSVAKTVPTYKWVKMGIQGRSLQRKRTCTQSSFSEKIKMNENNLSISLHSSSPPNQSTHLPFSFSWFLSPSPSKSCFTCMRCTQWSCDERGRNIWQRDMSLEHTYGTTRIIPIIQHPTLFSISPLPTRPLCSATWCFSYNARTMEGDGLFHVPFPLAQQ